MISQQKVSRSSHKQRHALQRASFEVLEHRQMLAAHIVGNSTVFSTIQGAVDAAAPGATITVDPGQYNEMVWISKQLTLRGAGAGVDARSNMRAVTSESVMNGALNATDSTRSASFYIAADDVTIDGFTVQNETNQSVYSGAGIVIAPKVSGTHVFNNIVQNNVAGLFLANYNDAKPAVIYHNLFRDNNNPGLNGGRGIFTDGGISGGNLSNVIIDSNAFIRNFGGQGTTTVEAAVAFEAIAVPQSNIRITNNVFDTNGKAVLFFHTSNVTIQNNLVMYCKDQWSAALRFEGDNHDFVIQGNSLVKNTGPAIRIDNKGLAGDNYNFTITQNNFYENGMYTGSPQAIQMQPLQYVGTVNAQNNWYNSNNGPSGAGTGSGELIVTNGINVNFSNWSTTRFPVATASAFMAAPQSIDNTIQVEDFDQGSEGYGYHDTEYTNYGTATSYRFPAGVDLENTSDAGGGFNIGYVKSGEWLNYTVNVAQAGLYNLAVRVASYTAGGNFHFELDGVNLTGAMTVPNTSAWQTYTTISKNGLNLPAGLHTLRLVMDSQGASSGATGNFNWFKFSYAPVVPAGPGMLVAQALSPSQVKLTWSDNTTVETNYLIERQLGTTGAWTLIQTLAADATSYIDTTVTGGNYYTYRVRAVNANGSSIASNEAAITVPSTIPVVYLSDMNPITAINGWGPIERDQSVGGSASGDGNPITLNGVKYTKGIGVHAVSDITYNLSGAYNTFVSDIGLDDETGAGSVVFQVFADNVKIYDSGTMYQDSQTQSLKLNVAGVQQLRLLVSDANGSTSFDHADWAGARVFFDAAPSLVAPANLVASPGSATQINLSWSDVAGETGFRIERSSNGNGGWTAVGATLASVTTFADTTVSGTGTFYYRVIATGSGTESAPSTVASSTVLLPPGTAQNLTATAFSPTQINLNWSASGNATGYRVERSLDGSTSWAALGSTTGLTFFSDTTVSGASAFYYRVVATNTAGDAAPSSVVSSTPLLSPAAPINLTALPKSSSSITLSWSDVMGENGYRIERSLDGQTGWTEVGAVLADITNFTDANLNATTSYSYRIRATNTAGDSSYTSVVSATTLAIPAPAAPSNLTAVAASGTQINLNWTDNATDETSFILERSADGVTGWTQIATPAANITSYSDKNLAAGATWFYRIRATGTGGDSANSNIASATTTTAPLAPSNLSATANSSTKITLTWSDVAGETGFKIERSLDGATAWTQIGMVGANVLTYADATGLSSSTKYYYRVRATSTAGDSAYSAVTSATTLSLNGLPAGWSDGDIGPVSIKGSTTQSAGVYTMITGGSDIWNSADTEHLTYQTLTGDGAFIARVSSMQNTNAWANAGIQMRDTLAANSKQVSAVVTPTSGAVMTFRTATGGATDGNFKSGSAPEWFKLVRAGSTFTAYQSENGSTWTSMGSISITMGSTIYVGLVGTAKNTTTTNTIKFDNVALQPVNVVPTAPAAPTGLVASATSASAINLTWADNSANETNFIIERSTDGITFVPLITLGANITTYSDTGLTASTKYYYQIRATNAVGDSNNSGVASATTQALPTPPAAPSAPVASATSASAINLAWTDNATNETGFKIERSLDGATGWTQIATTAANVTTYSDTGLAAATQYYYRIRATNLTGDSAYTATVNATTQAAPTNGLPLAWTSADIGPVQMKGTATFSNGTYTVTSGGSDIWNNSDNFQFVYTTLTGDGTIIARVASMQNTNAWANAGIQIRESLAANAKEASLVVTPTNGLVMTSRKSTGGTTDGIFSSGGAPEWLKLVRQGSTITSYKSNDGIVWTQVGSVNITMGSTVYVGLAVTSKNATTTNTAKFDNVSVIKA
ncbi:MAG TPA: NPCBM/NEW2 domain-containing protein [Tepidisphaeraceae bacterium]